jgi:hypothetical protein
VRLKERVCSAVKSFDVGNRYMVRDGLFGELLRWVYWTFVVDEQRKGLVEE